jgi:hypothetical protein
MTKRPGKAPGTGTSRNPVAAESVEDAIQRRAYELHLEHGSAHGRALDDWLEAEREIQARRRSPAAKTKGRK